MYNHLIDFIDSQNIFYKFQFGFRKQFSASHDIISLEKNMFLHQVNLICVFLELKKK